MTITAAHLFASLCLGTIFFQLALIGGVPLGAYTQSGQYGERLPLKGKLMAALAIPVLLFQAIAILSAAGFPGLGWPVWTGWVALVVALATVILNGLSPSEKERAVWFPVSMVMAGFAAYVMAVSVS